MDEKTDLNPTEIQEAMAEKRASLRESLFNMEKEAEKRVRQTLDEVQHKILATSDEITRKVTHPLNLVQQRIEQVPKALQEKPVKTLLVAASVGTAVGFLLGRRGRHRYLMTRALLATAEPRVDGQASYKPERRIVKPTRGFVSAVAGEVAHQILMSSLTSLLRPRQ